MLVKRRRPALPRDPNGVLHWATIFIAREHRRGDLEDFGEWICPCRSCEQIRYRISAEWRREVHQ